MDAEQREAWASFIKNQQKFNALVLALILQQKPDTIEGMRAFLKLPELLQQFDEESAKEIFRDADRALQELMALAEKALKGTK